MAVSPMSLTLKRVQSIIGYKFKNVQYIREAMQGPQASPWTVRITGPTVRRWEHGLDEIENDNRGLAIVGDVALRLALRETWYRSGLKRGESTQVLVIDLGRSHIHREVGRLSALDLIETNDNLSWIGLKFGFDALVHTNHTGTERLFPYYLATAIEAILGAAYLDSGMTAVHSIVSALGLRSQAVNRMELTGNSLSSMNSVVLPMIPQKLVETAIQSAQGLRNLVSDVLHPAFRARLKGRSADPFGTLRAAFISAARLEGLVSDDQSVIYTLATLRTKLSVLDMMRSTREMRILIAACAEHLTVIWRRQELRSALLAENMQNALLAINISCVTLTDDLYHAFTSIPKQQILQSYEESLNEFERLASPILFGRMAASLAPGSLIQESIKYVMRSGREVQPIAITLHRLSNTFGPLVQPSRDVTVMEHTVTNTASSQVASFASKPHADHLSIPSKEQVPLPHSCKIMSYEGREVQDQRSYLSWRTMEKVGRTFMRSHLSMERASNRILSCIEYKQPSSLLRLRQPIENFLTSARQIQGLLYMSHASYTPYDQSVIQRNEKSFQQLESCVKLHNLLGNPNPSTSLRRSLDHVLISGRQVQSYARYLVALSLEDRNHTSLQHLTKSAARTRSDADATSDTPPVALQPTLDKTPKPAPRSSNISGPSHEAAGKRTSRTKASLLQQTVDLVRTLRAIPASEVDPLLKSLEDVENPGQQLQGLPSLFNKFTSRQVRTRKPSERRAASRPDYEKASMRRVHSRRSRART